MELWIMYIKMNREPLIMAFFAAFTFGIILSLSTCFINREKRKKGFRKNFFTAKEKRIDRKMAEEYRNNKHFRKDYFQDDLEHHANKKY